MRGLIKKVIVWAVSEEQKAKQNIEKDLPSIDTYMERRVSRVERDIRMIMDHLNIWISEAPKVVKREGIIGQSAQVKAPERGI